MEQMKYALMLGALCLAGAGFTRLQAATEVLTIVNSQSSLSIGTGSTFAGSSSITSQGNGALSTSYSGTINVNIPGSTIQFPGGSAINALTDGSWQPMAGGSSGSAPADYGLAATVNNPPFGSQTYYGAVRNLSFDLTSATLPLNNTNFNGTNLVFSISSANAALDYISISGGGSGSQPLRGYATNAVVTGATVSTNGTTQTLTISVSAKFICTIRSANDTSLNLVGQIVATNTVAPLPPFFTSIGITNQNVSVTVENATVNSQLLFSTNLTSWASAEGAIVSTNNLGWVIFTVPLTSTRTAFRVQQ